MSSRDQMPPTMMSAAGDFAGTSRFHVVKRLGEGGMGVVYEAEDIERGQRVALKTFRRADSDTIFRLKREFRALAELSHPNLAALYDLVADGQSCFFTMELLDGDDFLSFVAPVEARPKVTGEAAFAETLGSENDLPGGLPTQRELRAWTAPTPRPLYCDERKLRQALPQLALGLHALHGAGKIHRDIKPSNIRVTPSGRVVLLDFGLVADLREGGEVPGSVVGTVAYMAPEQAAGERRLGPAVDWYAVGVVLYQALTGRLPFDGSPLAVLQDKQKYAPPPPRTIVPDVATDLDELATALLARDPKDRPAGAEILRRLGAAERSYSSGATISRDFELAGRATELAQLMGSLEGVGEGRASAVMVRGASGIGKSTLVRRFLDEARMRHPGAVVLAGRCYEHEAVPYRAMDGLIDQLSSHLGQLPVDMQRRLFSADAALLPTLFPVLGRVHAIAEAPPMAELSDQQERRTRAFGALRELLRRLASEHPLILTIDDMQWVDGDTGTLLADVMREPDPPPLVLVLSTRPDGSEGVWPLVKRCHAAHTLIELGPLAEDDAIGLAMQYLGPGHEKLARRVATEAAGSPFFVLELVRYMSGRESSELAGKGLDAVLGERIDQLGGEARAVAEVVAVAGEPITMRVAGTAAGLGPEELRRQVSVLRAQRFVRAAGGRADDQLEPYHDRVREALVALAPEERRQKHHRMIAMALAEQAPAERLARHWAGAGEHQRAAEYAWQAAHAAQKTLDFDRAAGFLRLALELGTFDDERARELRAELAGALSYAGQPLQAARAFSQAAEQEASATAALELRRRAADALLRGGYLEEGLAATADVLAQFGMKLTKTPRRALASMLWQRARLKLRGLRWTPRPLSEISQEELTRVDLLESVAMGLIMVDTFRSGEFGTRYILRALELGEPKRVARALALEADFMAAQGLRERAKEVYEELARVTGDNASPQQLSQLMTTQAMIEFLCDNKFRPAVARMKEATDLYRAHERRSSFEINIVAMFICWGLQYLGELDELSRHVPGLVEAAERAGDRFAAVNLRTAFSIVRLVRDAPDQAEAEVDDALHAWGSRGDQFQMQHFFAMVAHMDLALYRGRPEEGARRQQQDEKAFRRSLLHLVPGNRLLYFAAISRLHLARAAEARPGSSERRAAIRAIGAVRRSLLATKQALAFAYVELIDAVVALLEGDQARAVAQLERTIPALEAVDMRLYAQPAKRRLGELVGGDRGARLVQEADAWMAAQGIKNPERMMAMLAPGYLAGR